MRSRSTATIVRRGAFPRASGAAARPAAPSAAAVQRCSCARNSSYRRRRDASSIGWISAFPCERRRRSIPARPTKRMSLPKPFARTERLKRAFESESLAGVRARVGGEAAAHRAQGARETARRNCGARQENSQPVARQHARWHLEHRGKLYEANRDDGPPDARPAGVVRIGRSAPKRRANLRGRHVKRTDEQTKEDDEGANKRKHYAPSRCGPALRRTAP